MTYFSKGFKMKQSRLKLILMFLSNTSISLQGRVWKMWHHLKPGLVKWWPTFVCSLAQVKPQTPDKTANWLVVCEKEEKDVTAGE